MSEELDQAKEAMARAVKALDQDFSKLNTGRPSASILDNVKVDYYGVATPSRRSVPSRFPRATS